MWVTPKPERAHLLSMLFWATVLFLPYYLFNINIFNWMKNLFE